MHRMIVSIAFRTKQRLIQYPKMYWPNFFFQIQSIECSGCSKQCENETETILIKSRKNPSKKKLCCKLKLEKKKKYFNLQTIFFAFELAQQIQPNPKKNAQKAYKNASFSNSKQFKAIKQNKNYEM